MDIIVSSRLSLCPLIQPTATVRDEIMDSADGCALNDSSHVGSMQVCVVGADVPTGEGLHPFGEDRQSLL